MYRIPEISASGWSFLGRRGADAGSPAPASAQELAPRFSLLRWFSIFALVAILVISLVLATILSRFVSDEILEHDAALTDQFVVSVAETQASQAGLGPKVTLGDILDERANFAKLGVDPQLAASVRSQFYDHLRFLPDVMRAQVFARDRQVIWSTDPTLVGKANRHNLELEKAFASRALVATNFLTREHRIAENQLPEGHAQFFLETYMPLLNAKGEVASVIEIYKEPRSLQQAIQRGTLLVWVCTAFGALFLYLAMFWIIRRADRMLGQQQHRLVETEALCVIGEMSAAVAHGIRNPLATIRSSAELALDGTPESTRKNATDIISQVDRLGKWVRDLLVFSRPLTGENRTIDVLALVDDCLASFATRFEQSGISCDFVRPSDPVPHVIGDRALATQALANVVSNAIEALSKGGALRMEIKVSGVPRMLRLTVTDNGPGIAPAELDLVFRPYYTTKRHGLGLGMALVKRIMERFGGGISLQSMEGEGTQACLSFRVA